MNKEWASDEKPSSPRIVNRPIDSVVTKHIKNELRTDLVCLRRVRAPSKLTHSRDRQTLNVTNGPRLFHGNREPHRRVNVNQNDLQSHAIRGRVCQYTRPIGLPFT